jgi:hypothetical protein
MSLGFEENKTSATTATHDSSTFIGLLDVVKRHLKIEMKMNRVPDDDLQLNL